MAAAGVDGDNDSVAIGVEAGSRAELSPEFEAGELEGEASVETAEVDEGVDKDADEIDDADTVNTGDDPDDEKEKLADPTVLKLPLEPSV